MANAFSQLDTSFPSMDGKNTEAKIQAIQDYLYQLLEQLRYTLNNLNPDNFNETEVNGWVGETIVKPIHAEITDVENGLITYIDATAAGITVNVQKEYAAEWAVGTTYYLNDFVKVTTVNNDQTETVNFYKDIYTGGTSHTAAATNKPGSGQDWQTYWVEVAAADVAYSRFDITADMIRTEVSRASFAEGQLSTDITQTADEIRLEASRVYAPLWDSNGTYYKNNVVRTETGTPIVVKYWQCTADSTTQDPLDVAQTDWVQISAPAANSQFKVTAEAITSEVTRAEGAESLIAQAADAIKAQVTDGQGNYTVLNLKSDGLHIGNAQGTTTIDGSSITTGTVTANEIDANYVYAGEISADQITAGTLDAGNVMLSDLFTTKAKAGGNDYNCGTIGGVVYPSGGQYVPLIELSSEDGNHVVEIGNAEVRLISRNANTGRSVDAVIGTDEIVITRRTPSPKTYSLLALLDQIDESYESNGINLSYGTSDKGTVKINDTKISLEVADISKSAYIEIEPTGIKAKKASSGTVQETVDLLQPCLPLYRFTDMTANTVAALLSSLNANNSQIPTGPSVVVCGNSLNSNRCMVMLFKSGSTAGRGVTISPYYACNNINVYLNSSGDWAQASS